MPDVKISALPASTTPLAGTEVLPIVQSATTRQVSVANLTAGRAISASSITNSALTSGRVTFAGASGLLSDSATLTYNGTTFSATTGAILAGTSGRVGVGVTPTLGKLHVETGTTEAGLFVQTGGTTSAHSIAEFRTGSNLPALVIYGNGVSSFDGKVGIGTSSPINPLQVNGSITVSGAYTTLPATSVLTLDYSGGLARYFSLGADASTPGGHAFFGYSSNTGVGAERMRIDSSGNLLVGTTDPSITSGAGIKIVPSSAAQIAMNDSASTDGANTLLMYSTGASAYRFYVGWGGTIFATSIVISAISDERLKENIRNIETGLDAIMALKPRRFDWKNGKGQDKKNAAGFIAQEYRDIFPDSVSTAKAGGDGIEYLTMNHEELIPSLVKAIQDQQALIESLTIRLTALENK